MTIPYGSCGPKGRISHALPYDFSREEKEALGKLIQQMGKIPAPIPILQHDELDVTTHSDQEKKKIPRRKRLECPYCRRLQAWDDESPSCPGCGAPQ